MEFFIIPFIAFVAAILTFFSGFGLGTLLTPVFMLYFPVDLAIALTAIVHLFNNIFKLFLVGRNADRSVLFLFGIPAVIAALAGAWLMLYLANLPALFSYTWNGRPVDVSPVKFVVAVLLITFATLDLLPGTGRLQFSKSKLPLGGALSGFFGGLSGNQGALRSAFLVKSGLTKESFIATAVVVSFFVDVTRLSVYSSRFAQAGVMENLGLVVVATVAGIAGSFLGNRLLRKVTLKFIRIVVAVLLIGISLGLGAGLL